MILVLSIQTNLTDNMKTVAECALKTVIVEVSLCMEISVFSRIKTAIVIFLKIKAGKHSFYKVKSSR